MAVSLPKLQHIAIQAKDPLLVIIGIMGIIYLASKISILTYDDRGENGLDFRYVWLAGKIWASGHNPYGPLFEKEYYENFNLVAFVGSWVYPPYWYPIALPFGLLPFQVANFVWRICNFLLLIGSTHLIARALTDVASQKYWPTLLGGIGVACFMQATVFTLFLGQTSILIYFGVAAIIFGILKANSPTIITGLIFLALKPQIGVVAFLGIAAFRQYRWTILPAVAACVLSTTLVAVSGSYGATIETFLANLTTYDRIPVNAPASMTGLINISDYAVANSIGSAPVFILVAAVFSVVVFYGFSFDRASKTNDSRSLIASLALFVASMFFILPLHSYDLVALSALSMMIMTSPFTCRYLIAFGLLICLRPRNVFDAMGSLNSTNIDFPESRVASAGLLFIFIGALSNWIRTRVST